MPETVPIAGARGEGVRAADAVSHGKQSETVLMDVSTIGGMLPKASKLG